VRRFVRRCLLGADGLGDGVHWHVIRNIRGRGLAQSNHGIWYDGYCILHDHAIVLDRVDKEALMRMILIRFLPLYLHYSFKTSSFCFEIIHTEIN